MTRLESSNIITRPVRSLTSRLLPCGAGMPCAKNSGILVPLALEYAADASRAYAEPQSDALLSLTGLMGFPDLAHLLMG
jgi:hypothetical protein